MGNTRKREICSVPLCNKRRKKKFDNEDNFRSDSDGTEDEETEIKRLFPRTFHRSIEIT